MGEIPNLLGLYSRSYPTTPLNHFFSLPPDSPDRLLSEVYGWLQAWGSKCLGFPNSNRRRPNNFLIPVGVVLNFDSENCLLAHNMLSTRQVPLMAER